MADALTPERLAPNPLLVPIAERDTLPISGGRARRVYGRSRTMLGEVVAPVLDSPRSGVSSGAEDGLPKESYKELRKRYEVDNEGDVGGDMFSVS
jgi:hypothetical protein